MRSAARAALRLLRGAPPAPGSHFTAPAWRAIEAGPLAGLEMFVHRGHGRSLSDRIVAGTYEPEVMNAIAAAAARGGCLYDIGAHLGYVACAWVRLGGSATEAFEPVESNARIVEETAVRNGLRGIRVHRLALADSDGTGRMRVNDTNLSVSSMAFLEAEGGVVERMNSPEYAAARAIAVPVRSLDRFVFEHQLPPPAAMKVDVEGAEGHVIRGAVETLARHRPVIICELHNVSSAVDVAAQLTSLGYESELLLRQKQTICNYLWRPRATT